LLGTKPGAGVAQQAAQTSEQLVAKVAYHIQLRQPRSPTERVYHAARRSVTSGECAQGARSHHALERTDAPISPLEGPVTIPTPLALATVEHRQIGRRARPLVEPVP
jgi:hypothetical protein